MDFVRNALVLVQPADSKLALKGLGDLAQPGVKRIAIGNPETVPAGRYAREALTSAKVWEALQPKMVPGESVRQVLDSPQRKAELRAGGDVLAGRYDWTSVAAQVLEVYETVTAGQRATVGEDSASEGLLSRLMSRGVGNRHRRH